MRAPIASHGTTRRDGSPEKLLRRAVLARVEARHALLIVRFDRELAISGLLGDGAGALGEWSSFIGRSHHPEVVAHVRVHPAQATFVVEPASEGFGVAKMRDHPLEIA